MAISFPYDGTQTAVIGTEHVLNTTSPETADGIYQLWINCAAMAFGDVTEIRIKEKVVAAGTQVTIETAILSNAPSTDSAVWVSMSLLLGHGWDMTIKQTAGTGRAYPYSIRKVA